MPNYQNGKIYKLVSNISSDIYIGSTVNKLSHRLNAHKKKSNGCASKQLFANDAVIQIILIELCPCNNKMELRAKEHHYITTLGCINKRIPFVTDIVVVNGDHREWDKAYNSEHAVEVAARNKAYSLEHVVEIATYKKAYHLEHAVEIAAKKKVYNLEHAVELAARKKAYKALHAVEIAARARTYYLEKKCLKQQLITAPSTLNQTLEV